MWTRKPGGSLASSSSPSSAGVSGLKGVSVFWRLRIDGAFDRVLGAVGRFEEHAAVLGFDEDAAGDGFLLTVAEEGDPFDGAGVVIGF